MKKQHVNPYSNEVCGKCGELGDGEVIDLEVLNVTHKTSSGYIGGYLAPGITANYTLTHDYTTAFHICNRCVSNIKRVRRLAWISLSVAFPFFFGSFFLLSLGWPWYWLIVSGVICLALFGMGLYFTDTYRSVAGRAEELFCDRLREEWMKDPDLRDQLTEHGLSPYEVIHAGQIAGVNAPRGSVVVKHIENEHGQC